MAEILDEHEQHHHAESDVLNQLFDGYGRVFFNFGDFRCGL